MPADAYEVYSAIMPRDDTYRAATTVLIQQNTVPTKLDARECLTDDATYKFADAIDDYERANDRSWLLQRQFRIDRPYTFVTTDILNNLPGSTGPEWWRSFHERYPDFRGYIIVSAVGFNKDRTLAVVYSGSHCGIRCGKWNFHLLEKVNGNWSESPGVRCFIVS